MEANKTDFKLSKFTIRVKMISIISLIMVVSISLMILIASYAFRKDSEIRVEELNIKLAEVIGLKVKTDIESVIEKTRLMANVAEQRFNSEKDKEKLVEAFFKDDINFMLFGIFSEDKGVLKAKQVNFNNKYLSENGVSEEDLQKLLNIHSKELIKAFTGESVIHNASQGFPYPIVAIALPHRSDYDSRTILITLFRMEKFLNAFKTAGISENFMVNGEGIVLAHPNSNIVLSGTNLSESPIVKTMMKSTVDNGLTRYEHEETKKYYLGSYKKIGFAGVGVISTVLEEKAFQEVYNIQRRNLLILGITLCTAILIVLFFANTLTSPILNLVDATKKIEEGVFRVDIKPTVRDEVGLLTNSFVKMGKGLEEREKVKDALGRFVNKEVAEMVLKGELKLGGEKKNCAIFFSDIRSFTAISEKLDPQEVVEFLNAYMTEMVRCVNETHGTVDKFIGDAVMATWGAAFSRGNDAENAVNGALMMRSVLLKFNEGRGGDKKPIIKIGCGLNYGPVVAGQIGSSDKMEYTVIGDAVNLASRVETLNKPFGTDILISEDLYLLVKDIFKVEKMKAIKVKGKEAPQTIYAVIGRFDDPNCPADLAAVRKLVGIKYEEPKPSSGKEDEDEEKEVKYEI
ncbi:MAG TPA: adenylate/guanylate cyclase domain-containing protein, partial [Leptospiraceae bacterium]|nr:adenylate/guanylate cyclase domain-containing protein [Leptospiraceae bacterium]